MQREVSRFEGRRSCRYRQLTRGPFHLQKHPEKVPFRLTRMLTSAMEVSGIEGTFKITCQHTMRVLRQNKESILAVLEAFVHDPLINWRLVQGGRQVGRQPAEGGENVPAGARRPRGDETNIHDGALLRRLVTRVCTVTDVINASQMAQLGRSTPEPCRLSSASSRSSLGAISSPTCSSRSTHKSTASSPRRRASKRSARCSSAGAASGERLVPLYILSCLDDPSIYPSFLPAVCTLALTSPCWILVCIAHLCNDMKPDHSSDRLRFVPVHLSLSLLRPYVHSPPLKRETAQVALRTPYRAPCMLERLPASWCSWRAAWPGSGRPRSQPSRGPIRR